MYKVVLVKIYIRRSSTILVVCFYSYKKGSDLPLLLVGVNSFLYGDYKKRNSENDLIFYINHPR